MQAGELRRREPGTTGTGRGTQALGQLLADRKTEVSDAHTEVRLQGLFEDRVGPVRRDVDAENGWSRSVSHPGTVCNPLMQRRAVRQLLQQIAGSWPPRSAARSSPLRSARSCPPVARRPRRPRSPGRRAPAGSWYSAVTDTGANCRGGRRRGRIAIHGAGILGPHLDVVGLGGHDRRRVLPEEIGRHQRHQQHPVGRDHLRRHRHRERSLKRRRRRARLSWRSPRPGRPPY